MEDKLDVIVFNYLKKKGYEGASRALQQDSEVLSVVELLDTGRGGGGLGGDQAVSVANRVAGEVAAGGHTAAPRHLAEAYNALAAFVSGSSLDM